MVGEIRHEELLRHHDRHHVVRDHVVEERTVECVAGEPHEIPHHGLIDDPNVAPRIPRGEPGLHLIDFGALCLDDRSGEGAHLLPFGAPLEDPRGGDCFFVVRDHPGEVIELARDRRGHASITHPASAHRAGHGARPNWVPAHRRSFAAAGKGESGENDCRRNEHMNARHENLLIGERAERERSRG